MSLIKLKNKKEDSFFRSSLNNQKMKEPEHRAEQLVDKKDNNKLSSLIIGHDVIITGKITADIVNINGKIDGEIECNSLVINESAEAKGKLKSQELICNGKVNGKIDIDTLLHIKSKGEVKGEVTYQSIKIEDGGLLIGTINSSETSIKKKDTKDKENWISL